MIANHSPQRASLFLFWCLLAALTPVSAQTPAIASPGAKIWVGRYEEFETFLRTAMVTRDEQPLPVGVTAPKKIALAPGGPVEAITWKPIRPGFYSGFYESYKSEIAATSIASSGTGCWRSTSQR